MADSVAVTRDTPEPSVQSRLGVSPPDLKAVYAEHASFVWRVLRGMGVHASMIPDAVQDVFIVVHRRYPEFDHRHKVRTWLFEIAYRVARDYRRKFARANTLFVAHEQEQVTEHSPAKQAEQNESVRLLAELLDKLDDDKRAVLVLAEIEGMTAQEIAGVTGVALNTVYSRLRRARSDFSQLVDAHERRQK